MIDVITTGCRGLSRADPAHRRQQGPSERTAEHKFVLQCNRIALKKESVAKARGVEYVCMDQARPAIYRWLPVHSYDLQSPSGHPTHASMQMTQSKTPYLGSSDISLHDQIQRNRMRMV